MKVSDADRAYFQRIGQYEAAGAAERLAAHLALPISERLTISVDLMRRYQGTVRAEVDDPTPFYDRAKKLGFYAP